MASRQLPAVELSETETRGAEIAGGSVRHRAGIGVCGRGSFWPAARARRWPMHTAIDDCIAGHNADPKPFRWTTSADDILASIERFCRDNAPVQA